MAKSLFKGFGKRQALPVFRKGKKRQTPFVRPGPLVIEEGSREDPRLNELARLLGSVTTARQVLGIQARDPSRTILECVVEWWLRKEALQFVVQAPMLGGRAFAGGTVVDAIVWTDRSRAVAIMAQGNYWHEDPTSVVQDASIKVRLLGQWVNGARIVSVVEVWESALYRNVEGVMRAAVAGLEVGR